MQKTEISLSQIQKKTLASREMANGRGRRSRADSAIDMGKRKCFLLYSDRWMRARDLETDDAILEAKMQEYQAIPWKFGPNVLQVDCRGYSLDELLDECPRLYDGLDAPTKRAQFRNEDIYCIQRQPCWIPRSKIKNMNAAWISYKKLNKEPNRRHGIACRVCQPL